MLLRSNLYSGIFSKYKIHKDESVYILSSNHILVLWQEAMIRSQSIATGYFFDPHCGRCAKKSQSWNSYLLTMAHVDFWFKLKSFLSILFHLFMVQPMMLEVIYISWFDMWLWERCRRNHLICDSDPCNPFKFIILLGFSYRDYIAASHPIWHSLPLLQVD